MRNYNNILVQDFWDNYSKNAIRFSKHPDLPLKLSLSIYFNLYFGKLTQHEVISLNNLDVLISCHKCVHVHSPKQDVCSAHIGIIQGQITEITKTQLILAHRIEGDICEIIVANNEK